MLIVIKTHGSGFSMFENNTFLYMKLVVPYLSKNVDGWFFLSQEEKKTLTVYAPKLGKKLFVTANIINPERSVASVKFLQTYGIEDNRFKFFFAGRMIVEKGIFSIIRAIPHFKYKEDCVFIFAGDGEDFEAFKEEIKSLDIEKYTHLTGFLPDAECDHFYANTDALVFPSYDEGFAMSLFKSVASGMPIITTRIRAAKDYLKEPDNCLWVDGKSYTSVLEALNRLYENDELRSCMAQNNVELGRNFSRQKVTQQMHNDFLKIFELH